MWVLTISQRFIYLRLYIKISNPECRIIIYQPVRRTDNRKATLTLNNLHKLLAEFDVDKTDNSNIDVSCLGKRRLHLNNMGTVGD